MKESACGSRSARARRVTALALIAFTGTGCLFLARKPALPQHAALEIAPGAPEFDRFAGLLEGADIIYFPFEYLATGGRDSSLQLLQAMQRIGGNKAAVAWDSIDSDEQPLLARWESGAISAEQLMAQLKISGGEIERENCRAILRAFAPGSIRNLALGCPDGFLAKLQRADHLDAAERGMPTGFTVANDDFEAFVERLPKGHGVAERELRNLYRAFIVSEQFSADRIVEYFNEHPAGKLLVFLHRRHLETTNGVPQFVAQKIKRRQIVIEPKNAPTPARSDLLTSIAQPGGRFLQIVDRAPVSFVDEP